MKKKICLTGIISRRRVNVKQQITLLGLIVALGSYQGMVLAQGGDIVAQDDASHYKTGSYNTNVNAGTGMRDAFTVNGPGGQFVGDSNKNGFGGGPGINTSENAFGLYQGETATRHFSRALMSGDTFSIYFDNGLIDTGGSDQLKLLDAGGKDVVTFSFSGGGQNYLLNGADTGIKFTDGGLLLSLTLNSPNDYSVTIKRLADSASVTLPGKLALGTVISGISVTNGNTVAGAPHDLFFNSLMITAKGK